MQSLYKSSESKAEVLAIYQSKLDELAIDYQYQTVETTFGTTNVIVTGNPNNPPLVLVHGSNGCAPIALELYPNLAKQYQVFAVDVIAQPNRSAETRPSMKDLSYGQWMNETINGLGLKEVVIAGFSFGGFVIMKTLQASEANIKKAFLIAPVGIVDGNPIKLIFKVFIPMRRFMSTGKPKFVEKFLSALFSKRDPFAVKFLSKVFECFEMDFTPIPRIKAKDTQQITTPITLFAAEDDLMGPGKKMIKQAKKLFPSLEKAQLLEGQKHVQDDAGNAIVERGILA